LSLRRRLCWVFRKPLILNSPPVRGYFLRQDYFVFSVVPGSLRIPPFSMSIKPPLGQLARQFPKRLLNGRDIPELAAYFPKSPLHRNEVFPPAYVTLSRSNPLLLPLWAMELSIASIVGPFFGGGKEDHLSSNLFESFIPPGSVLPCSSLHNSAVSSPAAHPFTGRSHSH